jgi:uncharacterized membrane protein
MANEFTPAIIVHFMIATFALAMGMLIFANRKGTPGHKLMGKLWVTMIAAVALSSFFIHTLNRSEQFWGLSWMHLFSVYTLSQIGLAIWHIRHGRGHQHGRAMKRAYITGLAISIFFTLLPSGLLHKLVFGFN